MKSFVKICCLLVVTTMSHASEGPEKFEKGQAVFNEVKEKLLKHYYDQGLSEEDLYRAAVKGMLENMDPKMANWNRLLTPSEWKELKNDLAAEVVGAGVEISFESKSGLANVDSVISESPADKAGIQRGDQILRVNGKLYRGAMLEDLVSDIRGKEGERRVLTVLRDGKLFEKTLVLKRVPYANISWEVLPNKVGLLSIGYFAGNAQSRIKKALEEFTAKKVSSIVVDLRGNNGGILEMAVRSAELFLPKGAVIVQIKTRGGALETERANLDSAVLNLPVVVLVDGETSSGAEVFAAALQENRGAKLVGTNTLGKWSVQRVDELPNQYSVKYTVGILSSSKGNSYAGKGITPDVEVSRTPGSFKRHQKGLAITERLTQDGQLRTALALVGKD